MEREEVRARVEAFPRWHYEFDLDGVLTPIKPRSHANRHVQRKRYFFDPLVRLCGGTLAGRTVLDLGSNAGFWSLAAIEAGADHVLGVDGRQMHVDQANFVFDVKGIDPARYRFEHADIFELDLQDRQFDIVLCLGLLYHVAKPFELMERIAGWNTDLLVIDTTVDPRAGALFRVTQQDPGDPRSALGRPVALHPTSAAVRRLAEVNGYTPVMLRPQFTDWTGAERYRAGERRAFICAKRTALDGLDGEPDPAPGRVRRIIRAARAAAPAGRSAR